MVIRKKDVRDLCGILAAFAGPFALYDKDGGVLYAHPEFRPLGENMRVGVPADDSMTGYVEGAAAGRDVIASLIGLYLKNIGEKKVLAAHTLHKYRELSFISSIHTILSSSTDICEILCAATKRVHEIIDVESCSVMVADRKSGRFIIKAISGMAVNQMLDLRINEGIGGKVYTTGCPIISNKPSEHASFGKTGNVEIFSLLCLPLKVKDATIGVLTLRNKANGVFTSEDEALMSSICIAIAEVIDNARLLEEKIKDEKFAAIGQMAAGIIHDIKNPMTTIKGFAGLLGDVEFTKEERKEYGALIVSEVDRLVNMVEDLLSFTRGAKTKLSLEKMRAADFLALVLPYIEKDMAPRNIKIVSRLDYEGYVGIDIERFKRAVFNIAGNAREVMYNGGKFLTLVRKNGAGTEIVFSDTGGGVPEDIIETLFEPFITKGKKTGTGLGLAVAKKIVEEHGGTIKAVNGNYSGIKDFTGANFVIALPPAG